MTITKKTIAETPRGFIYELSEIPNNMFQFYILEKREYKNGERQYEIGAYLTSDPTQSLIIKTLRCRKKDVILEFDDILDKVLASAPALEEDSTEDSEDDELSEPVAG